MPYIKDENNRRHELRTGGIAQTAGELNYQIFWYVKHHKEIHNRMVMEIYIKDYVDDFLGEHPNYQKYNDMTGALIRCYLEIKRRLNYDADMLIEICSSYDDEIAKYEDTKIIENGDVD